MVCGLQTVLGGHGAPGIELAHKVRLPEQVGAVLSEAERAGATIVPPAPVRSGSGTSGAFADPRWLRVGGGPQPRVDNR